MLLRKRLLWVFLLLTASWGLVMQVEMRGYVPQPGLFGYQPLTADCHHAHAPVISDLELAKTPKCFSDLIASGNDSNVFVKNDRDTNLKLVTLNTQLDAAFIALYWLTFLAFAGLYWPSGVPSAPQSSNPTLFRVLSLSIAITVSIAALYDVRENVLLFRAFSMVAQSNPDFTTSFPVSRIKWCVLGLATVLLGLLSIRDVKRLRKVFAIILLFSGVTIFAGTLAFSNPAFGFLGLSAALLLAIFAYFPWKIRPNVIVTWLVCAYLLRFQIISAFLLAVVLPAGYFLAPSIFYGLIDAIAPISFFLICFVALLLSLIIMITSRLTLAYASLRFPDLSETAPWMRSSWIPTILFSGMAIPMIVLTWVGTQDYKFLWWERLGEVLLAAATALLFLVATAELHASLEDSGGSGTVCFLYPPFRVIQPRGGAPGWIYLAIARAVALLPTKLQAGILRTQHVNGKSVLVLHSGHRLAATAFGANLVLYLGIGIATAPRWWEHGDESGESDLGAVGWGLLYPDLLRTIPGSGILNLLWPMRQHIDRGWALERQWNRHWVDHKTSPTLSQWNADVANGTRPAVIFNATVAESGERFVAATTDLYEQKLDQYRGTVQFFHRFQGADLPVSTAARLSATFPFVSPMARADTDHRHGDMHVGDGGYYDNSGLLSATQWLRGANQTLQDHQVILLIIDSTPGSAPLGEDWTWQRQTVAPIDTLLGVRTSSQQLRARYEQDLLRDLLVQELGNQPEPLIPVYFRFQENSTSPLSWHLRPDQLREIGDQWRTIQNSIDARKVYDVLHCPGPR